VLPNKASQQIYTFNDKPGAVNIFDIRMAKLMGTVQIYNDEVTSVAINDKNDTVVAGFRDGTVKIMTIGERADFETREQMVMFSALNAKKAVVTQVKINPRNGALFGASNTGSLKLLRTKV